MTRSRHPDYFRPKSGAELQLEAWVDQGMKPPLSSILASIAAFALQSGVLMFLATTTEAEAQAPSFPMPRSEPAPPRPPAETPPPPRSDRRESPSDESMRRGPATEEPGKLDIPRGQLPPPGSCRIWFPGRPPGQQPPPGDCGDLAQRVPAGAWLISRRDTSEHVYVTKYDGSGQPRTYTYDARSGRYAGQVDGELPKNRGERKRDNAKVNDDEKDDDARERDQRGQRKGQRERGEKRVSKPAKPEKPEKS